MRQKYEGGHVFCPHCGYEGEPKRRISTFVWWMYFLTFGGFFGVIGIAYHPLLIIPLVLLALAVAGSILNATLGVVCCPRCTFTGVVPHIGPHHHTEA